MSKSVIFYDLVPAEGSKLFYSPNTMKTRLCLAHKGVPFETKIVTYNDTRTWLKEKTGFDRVFCPMIETPDGQYIMDSWKIAEWLDETYPEAPSIFHPDGTTPVDQTSPSYALGKNFAWIFSEGFGSSDSQWSTFIELAAEPLRKLMDPEVAEYFASDAKNGKGAWAAMLAKDQTELLQHAKSSLLPLESTLSRTQFLNGDNSGYVDYVAYGRYIMMRSVVPQLAEEVWENAQVPRVKAWLRRLESKFAAQLKEVLDEM